MNMVDARDMSAPAQTPNITSQDHEDLLNTIDKVRALGVGRYLDIPQVVVCGDQSSGKSDRPPLSSHPHARRPSLLYAHHFQICTNSRQVKGPFWKESEGCISKLVMVSNSHWDHSPICMNVMRDP